jgi:cobalt-zinc-cadmium efflux system membrane fusion protein
VPEQAPGLLLEESMSDPIHQPNSSSPTEPVSHPQAPVPSPGKTAEDAPPPRQQVLGSLLMVTLVLGAMTFFLINAFEIPIPGLDRAAAKTVAPPEALGATLVPDVPNTLTVPESVQIALGIRNGKEERVEAATVPTRTRPLTMSGSTALDPTQIMRIRARFPAEVVEITKVTDPTITTRDGRTGQRELRAGDRVNKGEVIAVFYSADVGNKKNDLIDALVQLKLDKEILERAEKAAGAVPEVFLLNARRNLESDRNAIARAYHTLRTWNIADEDVKAVEDEAKEIIKRQGVRDSKKTDQWARVELKAPDGGVIVERNVSVGEMVVDNTTNLFQIAKVDRLLVTANAPEDELPNLLKFFKQIPEKRTWAIKGVGTGEEGIKAPIDDISYLIDIAQHSAVVKGYITNPDNKLRAGQYITASVQLPPPENVVEIPISSIVDDGRQCILFVQRPGNKEQFTMRRVEVTHRFERTAFVRSKPFSRDEALTPEEKDLGLYPREPLGAGERVLLVGALELKKELEDQLNKAGK